MTARTKRLFSASQPAGNWEAFFGYLITSTKEVRFGLVALKKKKRDLHEHFLPKVQPIWIWIWIQELLKGLFTMVKLGTKMHRSRSIFTITCQIRKEKATGRLWFDVLKKIWLLDPGNLFTRGLEGMLSSFNCWFLFINCYTLFIWKSPKLYITNIKWVNI